MRARETSLCGGVQDRVLAVRVLCCVLRARETGLCDGVQDRVPAATLLSVVDVTSPATLYGLAERTVAVESL